MLALSTRWRFSSARQRGSPNGSAGRVVGWKRKEPLTVLKAQVPNDAGELYPSQEVLANADLLPFGTFPVVCEELQQPAASLDDSVPAEKAADLICHTSESARKSESWSEWRVGAAHCSEARRPAPCPREPPRPIPTRPGPKARLSPSVARPQSSVRSEWLLERSERVEEARAKRCVGSTENGQRRSSILRRSEGLPGSSTMTAMPPRK